MTMHASTIDSIRRSLVGLRMPRALEALDATLRRIEQGEIDGLEAFDQLLVEELTLRETRRIKAALMMARLTAIKTLTGFDFTFQPSLDRNRVMALAELKFIDRAEVVHLLGPPGTGKSQVSMACRVRCHGEDEGAHSFDEVIADRTRLPACREPGHSAGANRAESGFEDPERSVDRLVTVTSQSPTRPRRRGKSNMIAAPGPQDLVGRE